MESSRDSSVWRSLAVTFGGGLALGAVGMKLTQTALRPIVDAPPRPDPNVTERLKTMEQRLERVEHAPARPAGPAAAPSPAPAPAPAIDQKVLEAVIGAVDARLHEQAGQMERRLADLEARFAIEVQALKSQGRQSGENEKALAELHSQLRQEAADLRTAVNQELRQISGRVSQTMEGQAAMSSEVRALHQQSQRLAAASGEHIENLRAEQRREMSQMREGVSTQMHALEHSIETRIVTAAAAAAAAQFDERLTPLRAEIHQKERELREGVSTQMHALEQSIEARIVTAAAAAVAAQLDRRLTPLRTEIQQKEQELAELRQRLVESENSVLDVVSAIGDVCRQAAERISRPSAMAPAAPKPVVALESAPRAEAPTEEPAAAVSEPALPPGPRAVVETLAPLRLNGDAPVAREIPEFLHESDRLGAWRIPLVSSILVTVTTGALLLLHYL